MASHNDLGKLGEQHAVNYLKEKGYTILETNWFFRKAEVDIIALSNKHLIVAEVKTRSSSAFGLPQEFVSSKKIRLLVGAINEYVIQKDLDVEVRFDIISVLKSNEKIHIEHLKNAFVYF